MDAVPKADIPGLIECLSRTGPLGDILEASYKAEKMLVCIGLAAIPQLAEFLEKSEDVWPGFWHASRAVRTIARMNPGHPSLLVAAGTMVKGLASKDERIRNISRQALVAMGSSCFDAIDERYGPQAPRVQKASVELLEVARQICCKKKGTVMNPGMLSSLMAKEPRDGAEAALIMKARDVLANQGPTAIPDTLVKLDDTNVRIRMAAARALVKVCRMRRINVAEELGIGKDEPATASPYLPIVDNDVMRMPAGQRRTRAKDILDSMSCVNIPRLLSMLDEEDADMRIGAARALAKISKTQRIKLAPGAESEGETVEPSRSFLKPQIKSRSGRILKNRE